MTIGQLQARLDAHADAATDLAEHVIRRVAADAALDADAKVAHAKTIFRADWLALTGDVLIAADRLIEALLTDATTA